MNQTVKPPGSNLASRIAGLVYIKPIATLGQLTLYPLQVPICRAPCAPYLAACLCVFRHHISRCCPPTPNGSQGTRLTRHKACIVARRSTGSARGACQLRLHATSPSRQSRVLELSQSSTPRIIQT